MTVLAVAFGFIACGDKKEEDKSLKLSGTLWLYIEPQSKADTISCGFTSDSVTLRKVMYENGTSISDYSMKGTYTINEYNVVLTFFNGSESGSISASVSGNTMTMTLQGEEEPTTFTKK